MWRRVAAQSPEDVPANASEKAVGSRYLKAWDALSALLTQGQSLSGLERNCLYLNTHKDKFANVSSVTGFDFPSDSRGLAAVDWDHDGDLDVWQSNRTSPRIRFLRNETIDDARKEETERAGHWIAFRLEGTSCNRDAVGARVTINPNSNSARSVKTLRAGEGYLSQASKWLHFGLGEVGSIDGISVRWPDGNIEQFSQLEVGRRYRIVQGTGLASSWQRPGHTAIARRTRENMPEPIVSPIRIVPHRRMPIPDLEFTDQQDSVHAVKSAGGNATVVVVWATWCQPCVEELHALAAAKHELREKGISVVALCVDGENATQAVASLKDEFSGGIAVESTTTKVDLLQRMFVSRENQLSVPMSLLLDRDGRLAAIYKGAVSHEMLLRDIGRVALSDSDNRDSAVPFPGRWYVNPVPADVMSMVEKLLSANLAVDALHYLDRHLMPLAKGQETNEASVWSRDQIANAYFRVGVELAKQKSTDSAQRALTSAIELVPDLLVARAALASLLQSGGRIAECLYQYEQMLSRQPNNPLVMNDIAWLLISTDKPEIRNLARGLALAQRACEISNRRVPAILDTLADAYSANDQRDKAVETLRTAIQVATDSGQPTDKLKAKLDALRSRE